MTRSDAEMDALKQRAQSLRDRPHSYGVMVTPGCMAVVTLDLREPEERRAFEAALAALEGHVAAEHAKLPGGSGPR